VMLSRGKIQEPRDGEAAEAALRKMALLDTTAIPLDLLSSTERKAVLVLKQHALVTVERRSAGDRGGRRAGAQGETRQVRPPEACHLLHRPPVRCPRPALASPGAAHWGVGRAAGGGGEARGKTSLLSDVRGMCSSAGNFWNVAVIYEIQGKYEELHRTSLDIKTWNCTGHRSISRPAAWRVRGWVPIAGWSLGGVGPGRGLRGGGRRGLCEEWARRG
jgi:hypothetical protein